MTRGDETRSAGPDDLRRAFRRHAAGVAVVTARGPLGPVGLTATSLASLSADPPLLTFNVSGTSPTGSLLARAEHVGVHLLTHEQADLAERFARRHEDRFAPPTRWEPGLHGVPILAGVRAWMLAAVEHRFHVAGQVVLVGRVLRTATGDVGPPLLYHDGRFRRLGGDAGRLRVLDHGARDRSA